MTPSAPTSFGALLFDSTKLKVYPMNMIVNFQNNAHVRKAGKAAFVFFLVKGLLWIAAPFVFLYFA